MKEKRYKMITKTCVVCRQTYPCKKVCLKTKLYCSYACARKTKRKFRQHRLLITYKGKTQNLHAWGKELNITYNTLINRKRAGLKGEEILTKKGIKSSLRGIKYKSDLSTIKTCLR